MRRVCADARVASTGGYAGGLSSILVPVSLEPNVRFFNLDRIPVDSTRLSDEERARVARKATATLKQRQAASFQCVREVLGEVVGVPPRQLPIGIAEGGKPFLADRSLHFSVSHSGGVGMLAWGPLELGCDVEALITRPGDALARKVLSDAELARWGEVSATDRQAWLTRAWVRKEAVLKAVGSGLRIPPPSFDVGGGDEHAPMREVELDRRRWNVVDVGLGVPEGHCAALCIESERSDG
jgi:phosphopantetheinyl transferase